MKSIVLCFFIMASLAVNLVELYEYESNADSQGPLSRADVSLVGNVRTRRSAPDAQLDTQRNKRHIPGFQSPLISHYYRPASPIATYPVAAPLPAPISLPAPIPIVEETPYVPAYHLSPYGAYGSPYASPYGAHAVL